jgi:opacity protein-like surface antigen
MSYRIATFSTLVAVAIAGTAFATYQASAADLDPGYADVPPPVEQQVTFGSGWYVRGDIAAEKTYSLGVVQPANSSVIYSGVSQSSKVGYDLSLGGGYSFTNSIRGDITADFHQPLTAEQNPTFCLSSASRTCDATARYNSYDALANGYYDFGPFGIVTPYVGAGVGMAFGTLNTTLTGGANTYGSHYSYHNLAWALMAGVSVDVYNHTKLDIGYRYLNNGTVAGTKVYYNEVRAGLRYMIDN